MSEETDYAGLLKQSNNADYVAKCSPGLHLGETCEVWAKYWKTGTGTWDVKVYKMRFEDGHVREW